LPRTFGRAYGFDQEIIVVAFALVSLGRLADVHRTLHTAREVRNAIEILITIRHYFRVSRTSV
jgi:hypothetical protein